MGSQTGWTCSICQASGQYLGKFKTHCFYFHTNPEVLEFYQRSWAELLSATWLKRLTRNLISTIRLGRFQQRVL